MRRWTQKNWGKTTWEWWRVPRVILQLFQLKSVKLDLNKMGFYDVFSLSYRCTPNIWTSPIYMSLWQEIRRWSCNVAYERWILSIRGMTRCEVCLHLFSKMYICHDVEVKPHLQTVTGEVLTSSANSSDKARLDVSARNFFGKVSFLKP